MAKAYTVGRIVGSQHVRMCNRKILPSDVSQSVNGLLQNGDAHRSLDYPCIAWCSKRTAF
jgi:hypothetical protein